jgi:PEP-CTERM motif
MRYPPTLLCGVSLTLVLGLAGDGRADLIHWTASWSRSPSEIPADSPGTGKITLSDAGAQDFAGNSDLVATNLATSSTAPIDNPDVFTDKHYTLNLTLVDQASGHDYTFSFTGVLNGTLFALGANIKNTFTGLTAQAMVIGDNLYSVTIGPYNPPGRPDTFPVGSIGARAEVTVQTVPEPGSLLLVGLGAGLLVLSGRPRRARPIGIRSPR